MLPLLDNYNRFIYTALKNHDWRKQQERKTEETIDKMKKITARLYSGYGLNNLDTVIQKCQQLIETCMRDYKTAESANKVALIKKQLDQQEEGIQLKLEQKFERLKSICLELQFIVISEHQLWAQEFRQRTLKLDAEIKSSCKEMMKSLIKVIARTRCCLQPKFLAIYQQFGVLLPERIYTGIFDICSLLISQNIQQVQRTRYFNFILRRICRYEKQQLGLHISENVYTLIQARGCDKQVTDKFASQVDQMIPKYRQEPFVRRMIKALGRMTGKNLASKITSTYQKVLTAYLTTKFVYNDELKQSDQSQIFFVIVIMLKSSSGKNQELLDCVRRIYSFQQLNFDHMNRIEQSLSGQLNL